MAGGTAALAGAMILGPRLGKYNENRTSNAIQGHSMALSALGVFILWIGWFGFNGSSTMGISQSGDLEKSCQHLYEHGTGRSCFRYHHIAYQLVPLSQGGYFHDLKWYTGRTGCHYGRM